MSRVLQEIPSNYNASQDRPASPRDMERDMEPVAGRASRGYPLTVRWKARIQVVAKASSAVGRDGPSDRDGLASVNSLN